MRPATEAELTLPADAAALFMRPVLDSSAAIIPQRR
jgi:hypothetical protein